MTWDDDTVELAEMVADTVKKWAAARRSTTPTVQDGQLLTAPTAPVRQSLTSRQRQAYEFLSAAPDGLTDAELALKMAVGAHAVHTLCQRMEVNGWAQLQGGHWYATLADPEQPSAEAVREHLLKEHGISAHVTRALGKHRRLHAEGATHRQAA